MVKPVEGAFRRIHGLMCTVLLQDVVGMLRQTWARRMHNVLLAFKNV